MFQFNAISLGIIFITLGLVFWLAIRLLMRFVPRMQPAALLAAHPERKDEQLPIRLDAVLVVQPGGKVISVNEAGRKLFNLHIDELPNLERLSRKVRPVEVFLGLCAAEGQARFVLNGSLVEGTSSLLRIQPVPLIVVSIRVPQLIGEISDGQGGLTSQTLQTITELTQAMAANLDLQTTLAVIFDNVDKIIPADFMEITLWEGDEAWLVPYRVVGLPGVERKLELSTTRYHMGEGYSGYLLRERLPLLIPDTALNTKVRQVADRVAFPIHSYLGVPLIVANEFIGTLELGSLNTNTFDQKDLDLIRLLSGQAAIAIHNALIYREEQRRAAELSGLAYLAQAFSSKRDPKGLYGLLVQSIVPLIQVEIVGFLVYNKTQRTLEGQSPFYGLPQQFLEMYRLPVPPDSPIEHMLLAQDVILSDNAKEDPHWAELGLEPMAKSAGLRDTVLIPLTSGGHMLGYLQASNHVKDLPGFSQDELHLLMIIANQAAPVIENANLVMQNRQRAQRAEALRRIASLASSSATLDEVLKDSMQELAQLIRADVAAVFLLDQDLGTMRYHRASLFGNVPKLPENATLLKVEDPQFPFTVTGSQHTLITGNLSEQKAVIPFYQQIQSIWKVESVVVAPLSVRNKGIGELWLGNVHTNFFDLGDLQVAITAAGQLAGLVEQSYLSEQTDDSLRRRVEQLTALTRISRELNTSMDLNYLLELVYAEALRATRADCGTILLFELPNSSSPQIKVRYHIGDAPHEKLSPLELRVLRGSEPEIVTKMGSDDYPIPHEDVASVLFVPIIYQGRPVGLISLHARYQQIFDNPVVEIAQSLAAQAAVALGNAFQYEEQLRSSELLKRQWEARRKLNQISQHLLLTQSVESALPVIAEAIRETTPFQVVVISLCDPREGILHRVLGEGLSVAVWEELRSNTQSWHALTQLLQPDYQVGKIYFIPFDKLPVVPEDLHMVTILPSTSKKEIDAWDPDDTLLIPLLDSSNNPLGLISLDAPSDGRRPDRQTYETLELFAMQACLLLENQIHISTLSNRLKEFEIERGRLEESVKNARQHLPFLLHQGLEKTVGLQKLNHQIERVRHGLEMAEVVGRQNDLSSALRITGRELLTRFDLQTVLIAEKTPSGPRLIEVMGILPPNTNPESHFGQRNPLRQLLEEQKVLLVSDLAGDTEWRGNSLLSALHASSMIGLPVTFGDGHTAGVLAIGQKQLPGFQDEDRQVFTQVSRQVSVSLQNLFLLMETRRRLQEVNLLLSFSRSLGSLNPASVLHSLLDSVLQVISAAHASWVALWSEKDQALLPQAASGYSDNNSLLGIRFVETEPPGGIIPLPLRIYRQGQPARINEVVFAQEYSLSSEDLMLYRKATGGRLPVSSMLIPLRRGENELGILVLDNFNLPAAFSEEDENLTQSLAQQAALALENAHLFVSAERRAAQLQALTQVAGTITSSLQSEDLIASLLDQLKAVLPYDTAILWLRRGSQLTVAAANGFSDAESRIGISVDVADSLLFQQMIQSGQAISVVDIRSDPRFPSIMEPDKFSWLGLPLMAKSQLVGVIALEKEEAGYYTPDAIQAATTFASQAAVALENARLFEESVRRAVELDQRSQRLALLNTLSSELAASLDVNFILKLTAQQLLSALSASRVAAILVNERGQSVLQVEVPAWVSELPQVLPEIPLLERLKESQGIFNASDINVEPELSPLLNTYFAPHNIRSLLIVPLLTGSNLHGWLWVQTSQINRFSSSEIELARTISNQAAIAMQNARLYVETRQLKDDLELRVEERTIELRREHQNTETLLKIITELSASLDMGLVLSRTLGVLNESSGAEQSIIHLAQSASQPYRAGLPLVQVGPEAGSTSFHPEQDISRWVIRRRVTALVDDVKSDGRWSFTPDQEIGFRSAIAVPLILGEEVLGALLLFHRLPGFFILEQVSLVEATARQIAIALNNAELFNLIRDQAERLGGMLREQHIEASRSRAILESVADGVLVTDSFNHITLFNSSAESILGLKASEVIGQALEQFTGLFGKETRTWMNTIRRWSEHQKVTQVSEIYSEQLDLEGGKIISVHLAPVTWRTDFLGTVSIFRDITHEVQVDRLKSEFLANVSHELRTPMTSIKGYAEIMLMGASGDLNPQQIHFLEVIKSNAERLSVLVNDLLDLSRVEAGRITLNFLAMDITELVEEVIADLKRRSAEENKPMTFIVDIAPDLPPIIGDAERIRQILANLIGNSYNYTPLDGKVMVKLRRLDSEVQVDIEDNGVGILIKDQPRVFERFYRGNDPLVLATAGTGLGLAMAKTLVEMHHGRIWFHSSGAPGKGSIFSFIIPLVQPEE